MHALVERATAADGDGTAVRARAAAPARAAATPEVRNLLVREGDAVVAYAHLDVTDQVEGSSAELVVAPAARGRGLGRALVEALLEQSPDGRLRLWAHGDSPAAPPRWPTRSASRRSRVLFQMRRPLSTPLPERSCRTACRCGRSSSGRTSRRGPT